jgi:hypothetical protein
MILIKVKLKWVTHPFFITPLEKMQPTVSKENNTYTFTLWREGKVIHEFKDACVIISYGNEMSIPINQLAKMNGPSYNGWTYHIYVQQHHAEKNTEDIFIWLYKEDFETLWPILDKIDRPQEEYDEECSYCINPLWCCECDQSGDSDDLRSEMLIKRGY